MNRKAREERKGKLSIIFALLATFAVNLLALLIGVVMAYSEELAERIRTKLKSSRGVTEKKMFGGVGFLVNGNMACGIIKDDLIVRLSEEEFAKALKRKHVRVFDLSGKPMAGWIYVAPEGCKSEKSLAEWMEKGIAFAKSLPKK